MPPCAEPEERACSGPIAHRSAAQFWSFSAWKSFLETSRKDRKLKQQLQSVKKDLALLSAAEVKITKEDAGGAAGQAGGAIASDTAGAGAVDDGSSKDEAAEELAQLRQKCAQLEGENRLAEQGLDRALQTLQAMKTTKDNVLRVADTARRNLAENAASFCYHNSNAEKYLDHKEIRKNQERAAGTSRRGCSFPYHPELQDHSGFAVPRVDIRSIRRADFLRDFVARNRPCIFTHVDLDGEGGGKPPRPKFGCFTSFTQALAAVGENTKVRVNATPDGYGDAVVTVPVFDGGGHQGGNNSASSSSDRDRIQLFVKPHETDMSFGAFCDDLFSPRENAPEDVGKTRFVPYLSMQDDCLRQDDAFRGCEADRKMVESFFKSFGVGGNPEYSYSDLVPAWYRRQERTAFGPDPDLDAVFQQMEALNLWVGDERSLSSFHKDNYENLYLVTAGAGKVFWLAPPCSAPYFYQEAYQTARYRWSRSPEEEGKEENENRGKWSIDLEGATATTSSASTSSSTMGAHDEAGENVGREDTRRDAERQSSSSSTPWSPIDIRLPYEEILRTHPRFAQANCKQVLLKPGEMLYLPRLWMHAATQKGPTIALNAWYDMCFDHLWCYQSFLLESCGGSV
eukprot:g9005.t1